MYSGTLCTFIRKKKRKKEILAKNIQNEENVKNVQEINNTQYPDHVEQVDIEKIDMSEVYEKGEEIPCTEKDIETQEKNRNADTRKKRKMNLRKSILKS